MPTDEGPIQRLEFRVRYADTDQMGTYYNARVLEWFEFGRTELLRSIGLPYTQWEERGVLLPVVEAHLEFLGTARYDDLLAISTGLVWAGRIRLRFEHSVCHVEGDKPVSRGYTTHALTDSAGRPIRPPAWLVESVGKGR